RNFTDAASQIQYRTAARFFLNASVSSHAAATPTVDCQRWFAKGSKLVGIIASHPFSEAFGASSQLLSRRPALVRRIPQDAPSPTWPGRQIMPTVRQPACAAHPC